MNISAGNGTFAYEVCSKKLPASGKNWSWRRAPLPKILCPRSLHTRPKAIAVGKYPYKDGKAFFAALFEGKILIACASGYSFTPFLASRGYAIIAYFRRCLWLV